MPGCKFLLELKAPANPENIARLYQKIHRLVRTTSRVSLASKPFDRLIPGFDLSYNLANFLLARHPDLDILFHVTCHDLNKVNIRSRLGLLQQLKIRRLLVVSGDGYEPAEDPKLRKLQFAHSHELVERILSDFNWFKSIAVAGYPGGNGKSSFDNQQECQRLAGLLSLGVGEIYTQCVFDFDSFAEFDRLIKRDFCQIRVIPSVALFTTSTDMDKIKRLTRVDGTGFHELENQLAQISPEASEKFSSEYLVSLCSRLATRSELIDLSTFGRFDLAESLIDRMTR